MAGVVIYEEGNKKIEIGGRIQVQYTRFDPDEGESKDRRTHHGKEIIC